MLTFSRNRHWPRRTRLAATMLLLIFGTILGIAPRAASQEVFFEDSAKINLATVRGTKVAASANCTTAADLVCRPVHGCEMRFQSGFGPAWWMIEWPQPFRVSRHRIGYRSPIQSVGYRIKVSAVPLDKAGWAAAKPVFEFSGPVTAAASDGQSDGWTEGEWKPVEARFLRVEWLGHNGGEKGARGSDHADLIVGKVQIYGVDRLPITPAISSAQAAWAGGEVELDDARGGSKSLRAVIDDSLPESRGFGTLHQTYNTNPASADPTRLPVRPASFIVTLKHTSLVEAVGYSAIARSRSERPRDVKVYTSPHAIGDRWELQKELLDIGAAIRSNQRAPERDPLDAPAAPASGADDLLAPQAKKKPVAESESYQEIVFDRPVRAKRVKFVVPRVWTFLKQEKPKPGQPQEGVQGIMAELYVYGTAQKGNLPLKVAADGVVTACIFDLQGKLVRTLWQLRAMKAGSYIEEWDGLADNGTEAPKGQYELGLVANHGRYENVAAIGNSGVPPTADGHVPMGIASVVVDADGAVFTVNGWDEAGHDWKKWDRDGRPLLHANFMIRNGNPNGLPFHAAVDDRYLYAAYVAHGGGQQGSHWVQRFDRQTGKPERFAKGHALNGLIQLYPPSEQQNQPNPVASMAVARDVLLVADLRAGRVLKYDKTSGELRGEFPFASPGRMTVDAKGRAWIAREGTRVVVVDPATGRELAQPITDLGKIVGLSSAPDGRLYVADDRARQVRIYKVDDLAARAETAFGQPAQPGDDAPGRFYQLVDVAAGPDGSVVTVDRFPVGGSRVMKWPARFEPARPLWTHLGLEFTGNANYAPEEPSVLVSSYFHRYDLDSKTGAWQFRGNLLSRREPVLGQWHGVPRWVTLGGQRFFYFADGDGMLAFRLARSGNTTALRCVMALGGRDPGPDGKTDPKTPLGQWTWTDANGNQAVDESELRWFKKPGQGKYAVFGMNVDRQGNILYCDHHTRAIWMIPMAGLNAEGNPTYDWAQARQVVPQDTSPVKFEPLMAVRTEKGEIYAMGRSGLFPPHPGSGPAWMGGWALAKYDASASRLWAVRLIEHCTGMDYVPGDGGVVVGHFATAAIYHYNREGVLVGSAQPGEVAGKVSGWLDNTASIACNRDPRDGHVDVFAEEDYAHRILWYRLDDAKIEITRQRIQR
jgi:hypothetical protein